MDVEIINNKNSLNFLAVETVSTLFFLSFSSRKCVTISPKKAAMQIFWNDYKVDEINLNDKQTRQWLLQRIINNSPNVLKDLQNFKKEEIKEFLYSYKPTFNKDFVNRRIAVLKKILFNDKNVIVKELEWN